MPGKINYGKDNNFFQKLSISSGEFPEQPQTIINFLGQRGLSFLLETSSTVEYSFNGNTTHGDMIAGSASSGLFFENRNACKIWWRVTDGASPAKIRIEAW